MTLKISLQVSIEEMWENVCEKFLSQLLGSHPLKIERRDITFFIPCGFYCFYVLWEIFQHLLAAMPSSIYSIQFITSNLFFFFQFYQNAIQVGQNNYNSSNIRTVFHIWFLFFHILYEKFTCSLRVKTYIVLT